MHKQHTHIGEILTVDRTKSHISATSRKNILEVASECLSRNLTEPTQNDIFSALLARERLGSTGIGHGVAIPHARFSSLKSPRAALLQLKKTVEFAQDGHHGVDLIFAFLVPEADTEEHLQIISTLAALFNEAELRENLRKATSKSALYKTLTEYDLHE